MHCYTSIRTAEDKLRSGYMEMETCAEGRRCERKGQRALSKACGDAAKMGSALAYCMNVKGEDQASKLTLPGGQGMGMKAGVGGDRSWSIVESLPAGLRSRACCSCC